MKILLPLLLLLTLTGCELSSSAQRSISDLDNQESALLQMYDATEDPVVRAQLLREIQDIREEKVSVRARDLGLQVGMWAELGAVSGLVGGAVSWFIRKRGKSRAEPMVRSLEERFAAFERGLQQPAPWAHPGPGELHVTNYPLKSSTGTSEPPTTETT